RIALLELAQRATVLRLLIELAHRHAELQQVSRRLLAVRIFLEALGKSDGGVLVVAPHVVGLAEPVLCVAGKTMSRIRGDESLQRILRAREVALLALRLQELRIGELVLRLGRTGGQRHGSTLRRRSGALGGT